MTIDLHFSPRRVYWPSQETITDFDFSSDTNTAGLFDLTTDGVLLCGGVSKGETLIFSTTDLWQAVYIGGDFLYRFQRAGRNCGIISKRAYVVLETAAYWMGAQRNFFIYDGYTKPLICEVADYVFGDFNDSLASHIWTQHIPKFGEIWWFYPSSAATSTNPTDRYVCYNYQENHWTYGQLPRAGGVVLFPGATAQTPILIGADGTIYDHETGSAGRSGVFLESGPMKIGEGDNTVRVQRIVPDDKTLGDVSATLYTSLYPDAAESNTGAVTLASPTSVRMTGRQFRLRLTEVVATAWRVGVVQLGGIISGRR
jgi:hypothetical protein